MREGRFGFPRPFGSLLSDFRPLIPPKFSDAPSNVGAIATKIDEDIGNNTNVVPAEGNYFIDFTLDVRGVDEVSRSSLAFTPEGDFLGGQIRASTFKPSPGSSGFDGNLIDEWNMFIEQEMGLDFAKDDIDSFIRKNRTATQEHPANTPHLQFTSKNPSETNPSPLSTPEILSVLERLVSKWPAGMGKYRMSGRIDTGDRTLGENTTEGSLSDMLDNL